jgi:hypothetical protein
MELTAYVMDGHSVDIRPAPVERDWMDASKDRFAYRCLPLNIANSYGWELLCPHGFKAGWNGGADPTSVFVNADANSVVPPAMGHFGHGVLTFHIVCLFRTEPGYDLMVQGPINRPKDAIAPLSGVIETDWAPYSFTMNWKFTRPFTTVRFEKGEPFCHFFPVKRGEVESFSPRLRPLRENPELSEAHRQWRENRAGFIEGLQKPGSPEAEEKWQRRYYRGLEPVEDKAVITDHRTRLRPKPFAT